MKRTTRRNPWLGFLLLTLMALMPRAVVAQDFDSKIKKLEELEARIDAKLKKLEELEVRLEARLKTELRPVAAKSSVGMEPSQDGLSLTSVG